MTLPLSSQPDSVCILRLSAIGDVTHALPVLRTLQHHWPNTRITWIIGKNEHVLVSEIDGVEFITFDKSLGLGAYRAVRQQLKGRHFDVLLHMQMSLRASMTSLMVKSTIRLGFDRERARDMQWLFTNHRILPSSVRQHVADSFMEFPIRLGLEPVMEWNLPVSARAVETVQRLICGSNYLVINPCAVAKSRNWRNWTTQGYAEVADYAAEHLGMTVVLTGGHSAVEANVANLIMALCSHKPVNLVGKTTLPELAAMLQLASAVIAPDTGPAHIASAVGTPTIGLYAATNPERAGPYRYSNLVVNKYPQALEKFYGQTVASAPWGKRIQNDECMALITVQEVIDKLVQAMRP